MHGCRPKCRAGRQGIFFNPHVETAWCRTSGWRRSLSHNPSQEPVMQYLLLIYANESQFRNLGSAELEAMSKEYGVYTQAIVKSGHLKGGERLRPTAEAQTVRVRDGKVVSTDGPFAETREQLAGFYLVEAKDMDEA